MRKTIVKDAIAPGNPAAARESAANVSSITGTWASSQLAFSLMMWKNPTTVPCENLSLFTKTASEGALWPNQKNLLSSPTSMVLFHPDDSDSHWVLISFPSRPAPLTAFTVNWDAHPKKQSREKIISPPQRFSPRLKTQSTLEFV